MSDKPYNNNGLFVNPTHKLASEHKHHLTVIAAMLAMIGPFTIDAYLPSFPEIEASFDISRAMLSQSMSVYLIAFAISTLLWGPVSDRIGRRLVILASMLIYIAASIGCAFSNDLHYFLIFRTIQGFAASGGFIASRAMIRDAHDSESAHRAMSQVMLLFSVAPAIAPVLGAWLQVHFGWRSVFWFLTAFGTLLYIMTSFIKETLAKEHQQSLHPKDVLIIYKKIVLHRQFIGLVLSISCSFAGVFLYISGAPSVIYDFLRLSSNDFGLLFIPIVCGLIVGSLVSGRLTHYWPKKIIIMIGFSIMIAGSILNVLQVMYLTSSVLTIVGPLVVYVFGLSLIIPAITITVLDYFPKNRGAAASMQGFFQMFTSAGVAGIAVPLLHQSIQHFVFGQAGFLMAALLLWHFTKRSLNLR